MERGVESPGTGKGRVWGAPLYSTLQPLNPILADKLGRIGGNTARLRSGLKARLGGRFRGRFTRVERRGLKGRFRGGMFAGIEGWNGSDNACSVVRDVLLLLEVSVAVMVRVEVTTLGPCLEGATPLFDSVCSPAPERILRANFFSKPPLLVLIRLFSDGSRNRMRLTGTILLTPTLDSRIGQAV